MRKTLVFLAVKWIYRFYRLENAEKRRALLIALKGLLWLPFSKTLNLKSYRGLWSAKRPCFGWWILRKKTEQQKPPSVVLCWAYAHNEWRQKGVFAYNLEYFFSGRKFSGKKRRKLSRPFLRVIGVSRKKRKKILSFSDVVLKVGNQWRMSF